ncbi:ATP-binding protein [Nonomuraea sp. NPDC050783]|uniref:ATP-binding protein n=1 Tax=Nonomuraea sp. NPDC050783 TaxID=3154634 RepID=UPI003465AF7F
MPPSLFFDGIPDDVPETVAAVARTRLARAFDDLARHTRTERLILHVGRNPPRPPASRAGGDQPAETETIEERARQYVAEPPRYRFDQLVIPADQADALLTAVAALGLRSKIYGQWGLRRIEPSPSVALNLHGPPGTGKTLAAHAIAARLGTPIIMAGYAEIESKFHGDGPKNVKAAFHAAERQGALLFIDEADSLLSRRLTDVTQGSEQAINSMRSQIVLCLDQFTGVVVFSTNLVANYDRAFESRVRHFHFTLPGPKARAAIWSKLLVPDLPLDPDVDLARLCAATDGFSGRDIKLAVLAAAERAAVDDRQAVTHRDLETAVAQLKKAREQLRAPQGRPATEAERRAIEAGLAAQDAGSPNGLCGA